MADAASDVFDEDIYMHEHAAMSPIQKRPVRPLDDILNSRIAQWSPDEARLVADLYQEELAAQAPKEEPWWK